MWINESQLDPLQFGGERGGEKTTGAPIIGTPNAIQLVKTKNECQKYDHVNSPTNAPNHVRSFLF